MQKFVLPSPSQIYFLGTPLGKETRSVSSLKKEFSHRLQFCDTAKLEYLVRRIAEHLDELKDFKLHLHATH